MTRERSAAVVFNVAVLLRFFAEKKWFLIIVVQNSSWGRYV